MIRSPRLAASVALLTGLTLAVSGCAAATPKAAPRHAAPLVGVGTLDDALAYQSAWHVEGGGTFASGSTDICDLHGPISIEDAKALANPDTSIPIFGFVLHEGEISYGTVWPTADPGTGVLTGIGSYVVDYDASGLPTAIHGTAKVTWRDPTKKPITSTRSDVLNLTLTKEPRAGHCDF